MTTEDKFPGFDYFPEQLSKFIVAGNIFTMMLRDGTIIHYTTDDDALFKEWLYKNKIEDIRYSEMEKA